MPTYDYECDGCRHRFEHMQSIIAKKLRKCPKCKKPRLRRLIGAGAGLIFRGSGFYATDYRSSKPPSEGKPPEKEGKAPQKKESEKSSGDGKSADKSGGTCGKTGPDVRD